MVKRSSQTLLVWFLFWDVLVTAVAWVAAYFLRFDTGIPLVNNHQPDFALCFGNLPLIVILAVVSYRIAGQYQIHRLRRFREELVAVAKGVGLMALLVMSTNFAWQYGYESRLAMVMFGLMAFLGVLTTRRLTWTAIGRLRAMGYNQSHALIVGTGRLMASGHIGRMAVLAKWRGKGLGAEILHELIRVAGERGLRWVDLDAQVHAIPFYEKAGFAVTSGVFMDASIPHRAMIRRVP